MYTKGIEEDRKGDKRDRKGMIEENELLMNGILSRLE